MEWLWLQKWLVDSEPTSKNDLSIWSWLWEELDMISRKEENRFSSTMYVLFFWPQLPILSSRKKQTTHNTRKRNSQKIIWVEQVVPTIKGILQNQVSQSSANVDVQWSANNARLAPWRWFRPCPPATWLLASNTTTTPLTGQYLPFLYNVAFGLRESFTIMVNNLRFGAVLDLFLRILD